MSIFSKFADIFREPDDDFDDDYDDDYGYDDEDGSAVKIRRAARSGGSSADDGASDDGRPLLRQKNNKKIVPYRSQGRGTMEVVVLKPEGMDDVNVVTDTLLQGRAVIINLEGQRIEIAQRIIDYTSGSCYAISGNLRRITSYIFLVTPPNIEISGDVTELANSGDIDLNSYRNGSTVRF